MPDLTQKPKRPRKACGFGGDTILSFLLLLIFVFFLIISIISGRRFEAYLNCCVLIFRMYL